MMERISVGIVGAGLSGLSAAAYLLKDSGNRFDITILEKSSLTGGQAASWLGSNGKVVEMGIHLDFPWYSNKLRLYEDIGMPLELVQTDGNYYICNGATGNVDTLYAGISVLKTLYGVAVFPGLSVRERAKIAKLFASIMCMSDREAEQYDNLSVREFLALHGATAAMQAQLALEAVTIQGLYAHQASATSFIKFMRTMYDCMGTFNQSFFNKPTGEALIDPLIRFIKSNGGTIRLNSPVFGIEHSGTRPVLCTERGPEPFDWVILAVPGHAVPRLIPQQFKRGTLANLDNLTSAELITLTLWYHADHVLAVRGIPDHNVFISNREGTIFDVLADKSRHWKEGGSGSIVQVLIDASEDVRHISDQHLYQTVLTDLARYFPKCRMSHPYEFDIIRHRDVYCETRPGYWGWVPRSHETPIPNVLLAGDYTAGMYHYGMESAVISGKATANIIRRRPGLSEHPMVPPKMLPLYKK